MGLKPRTGVDAERELVIRDYLPSSRRKRSPGDASIGGIVSQYREMITKKGDKMARFMLEDAEGTLRWADRPLALRPASNWRLRRSWRYRQHPGGLTRGRTPRHQEPAPARSSRRRR